MLLYYVDMLVLLGGWRLGVRNVKKRNETCLLCCFAVSVLFLGVCCGGVCFMLKQQGVSFCLPGRGVVAGLRL